MRINEIKAMPTVIENVHESCYQSYHILDLVLEMIRRGDSKETIFDIVDSLTTKTIA